MFNKNEFRAAIARAGKTHKDVAKQIGVDESTLYRKIQENGRFTRAEINEMIDYLKIENPKSIFFA